MSESLARPRRLEQRLDLTQFRSGAAELDLWLQRFAWENQQANNAVTYVTTMGERVVGYYAIASGSVELGVVPRDLKKGGRPDPLLVLILARLAVMALGEIPQGRSSNFPTLGGCHCSGRRVPVAA